MLLEVISLGLTAVAFCLAMYSYHRLTPHLKKRNSSYSACNFKRPNTVTRKSLESNDVHVYPEKTSENQNSKKSYKDINLDTELKNKRVKNSSSTGSDLITKMKKPQVKLEHLPHKSTRVSAANLRKLNDDARKRSLLVTRETSGPFTFVLDRFGGFVDTPICKIMFPYGAVSTTMEITMVAKYSSEDLVNNKEQVIMTPEIFFTSKHKMKFSHPVEVHMQTPYHAANRRKRIPVQIERTEHSVPLKWINYREVIFHKGMIKFFCDEFCGYRVRCDMCQLHVMSTRISYCFTVPNNINPTESEKRIHLRVFSDTPQNHENINREMKADGHHRIHPTQTYTVRAHHNLMIRIIGKDLNCLPSYHIAEVEMIIMSRAFLFTLRRPNNASSWEFDAEIAEISTFQKTKIQFDSDAHVPNGINSSVHINVSDHGIGMQIINVTESSDICDQLSSGEKRRDAPNLVSPLLYSSQNSLEPMFKNRSEGDGGNEDMETKPMKTWQTEHISHGSTTSYSSISSYSYDTVIPMCSAETKPKETWLTELPNLNRRSLTSRCSSAVSFTSQTSDTTTIVPSSGDEQELKTTVLPHSAFYELTRKETTRSDQANKDLSHKMQKESRSADYEYLLPDTKFSSAAPVSMLPVLDLLSNIDELREEAADREISLCESGFDSGATVNSRNMSAMSSDCGFFPIEPQYPDEKNINSSDQAQKAQDQALTETISKTSVKKSYSDVVKTKRTSRNRSCDDVKRRRPKWKY